ncbi:MAG: AzlD domain-containing protein [Coriobacteriales bacterium]|nr:AzlD domain-containing protein [Coriobacteriales bacterium]
MQPSIWGSIIVMGATIIAIRLLPLTLIRKPLTSRFLRSFLHYVPYVTLAVMTFPAIVETCETPLAGVAALVVGTVAAWMGANMVSVAAICCVVAFVLGLI